MQGRFISHFNNVFIILQLRKKNENNSVTTSGVFYILLRNILFAGSNPFIIRPVYIYNNLKL